MGKRGGEFLWKDRSGSGDSAVDIGDTIGNPATSDLWQGHFIGVMERIRAIFPNAKVVRDAILFADELVRQHRLILIWLFLLTLIFSDVAESTVDSLDDLVSKLLRRMCHKAK